MESSPEEDSINNKYRILAKKGKGATSKVYLVEDKKDKKLYAAKVLKEFNSSFEKEIKILKKLSSLNNPFIINLIEFGEGPVKAPEKPKRNAQYAILEYASKGTLFKYIACPKKGFSERHAKLIFHKILKGVQAIHNAGICHRDIKLENILLDDKFDPRICDFGFGTEIKGKDGSGKLDEIVGTKKYCAPEIHMRRKYNGVKADIFSLGVVLFILVVGNIGFKKALLVDNYYRYIIYKKPSDYWKKVIKDYGEISEEIKNTIINLNEQLKNLYIKMISYSPEQRPSIKDILENPWMKEVTSLDDKGYSDLEKEVYKEFEKREIDVVSSNESINSDSSSSIEKPIGNYKGLSDDDDKVRYFDLSLTPRYIQDTELNMENYIKINGNLRPCEFMNSLANKIVKSFEHNVKIDESKKTLKFNAIFKEDLEDVEEPDEELKKELDKLSLETTDEIKVVIDQKNCVIQIKLFQSINGGYIVRFMKKEGEIEDYYKNLDNIKSLIKKTLNHIK